MKQTGVILYSMFSRDREIHAMEKVIGGKGDRFGQLLVQKTTFESDQLYNRFLIGTIELKKRMLIILPLYYFVS